MKPEDERTNLIQESLMYQSLAERLWRGEKVRCPECRKGYFEPLNPAAKINHAYICNVCGANWHFDPVVIVE